MAVLTRSAAGRELTHSEMDENITSAYSHYGQINVTNNATPIALTAATDPTLFDASDYTQITGIYNAIPHGEQFGMTQQASSITVARNGVFQPQVWMSVTSDVNNTNVAVRFAVNGVVSLQRRPRVKIGTGGDRTNLSAHGFSQFSAGDVVTLWIASDKTANITIEDAVFSLAELRTL